MSDRTRFRLIGDKSEEHCGHAAVADVIRSLLAPHGDVVGAKDDFDALVVNGEGSMHHDDPSFLLKMHEIRTAQDRGKDTYLINSVWDTNGGGYDDCLARLQDFWVRGAASARDLRERHGLKVRHFVDLSYHAAIDETAPVVDFGGAVVATDVYAPQFGFVWLPERAKRGWINVDMRRFSWSSLVRSLRTASVLVAGRHHGMYAACKARIPFVPIRGNCHKFEDLLETAKADIPVAETLAEAISLTRWAGQSKKAYQQLFEWMDRQPRWTLAESGKSRGATAAPKNDKTLIRDANQAVAKRNHKQAAALWKTLLERKGADIPYARNACMALFGNGDVELAMEVLARTRLSKPGSIIFAKQLMSTARDMNLWLARDGETGWWPMMKNAAYQAAIGNAGEYMRLTKRTLDAVHDLHGPTMASSASFFLACKLVHLNLHDQAFELREQHRFEDAPDWICLQEDVLLNALCRRFDRRSLSLLPRIEKHESWRDPALRAIVIRYRLMFSGASDALFEEVSAHCREFPKHGELADLLYSIGGEMGRLDFVDDLVGKDIAQLERRAMMHLPLADYLVAHGLASAPALVERARLFRSFEAGREMLEATLRDPGRSIAVVGNSPSEIGRGRGAEIDAHDIVIRFNDFLAEPPFDQDYGRKVDMNFQTYAIGSRPQPPRNLQNAEELLVQRHAFNVFDPRDWTPVLQLHKEGRRLAYLPRAAYIAAAAKLGATPSAGYCVASYLKELRGKIDRSDFFGFSFVDQVEGQRRAHYFNDERPSLIHDWRLEAREFEKLFDQDSQENDQGRNNGQLV